MKVHLGSNAHLRPALAAKDPNPIPSIKMNRTLTQVNLKNSRDFISVDIGETEDTNSAIKGLLNLLRKNEVTQNRV